MKCKQLPAAAEWRSLCLLVNHLPLLRLPLPPPPPIPPPIPLPPPIHFLIKPSTSNQLQHQTNLLVSDSICQFYIVMLGQFHTVTMFSSSAPFVEKTKVIGKKLQKTLLPSSHKSHTQRRAALTKTAQSKLKPRLGRWRLRLIKGAHQPLQEMELFFPIGAFTLSVHWEEAVHIDFSATIIARSLICGPLLCTPSVVVWAGRVGRSGEVFARAGGTWDPFSQPLSFPGLAIELL